MLSYLFPFSRYHELFVLFIISTSQSGEVKEVRIVTNRAGKPKGYAYVEFVTEVRKSDLSATCLLPIVYL